MFSIIIAVAYAAMISGSLFAGGMTLGPGSGTAASDFNLHENIVGRDFYNSFKWETFQDGDPTHGRVNYVDQATALQLNLSYGELDLSIRWSTTLHSLGLHSVGIQVRHARRLPKRRACICARTEQRADPVGRRLLRGGRHPRSATHARRMRDLARILVREPGGAVATGRRNRHNRRSARIATLMYVG